MKKTKKPSLVETMMKCLKVTIRSSHPEMFYGKDFLKNIAKVSGKQLCRSHFLVKYQTGALQAYLKRDFDADFFSVNVEEFSCRFIFASHFLIFRLDLISWIGYRWIFSEDLFSRILVLSRSYILWFFALCPSTSSMWVTELLPKVFDISNNIIWI